MATLVRDLHIHSIYSDGSLTPDELVKLAVQEGVSELSLTDHDTFAGIQEAQAATAQNGISFMPGVEMTCQFADKFAHILGYGYIPTTAQADTELNKYLEGIKQRDFLWALEMCQKSLKDPIMVTEEGGKEHSITVTEADLNWVNGTIPSSFHLAVVVSKKLREISCDLEIPPRHCLYLFFGRNEPERRDESYWPEIKQSYLHLLEKYKIDARAYWWTERPTSKFLSAEDAIKAIEGIGGIPVLAHPGEQKLTKEHIEHLAETGIRGIEIYTFKHTQEKIAWLVKLAKGLNLFGISGTDFHDPYHRAQVRLGRDRLENHLIRGASLEDFKAMGACIYTA